MNDRPHKTLKLINIWDPKDSLAIIPKSPYLVDTYITFQSNNDNSNSIWILSDQLFNLFYLPEGYSLNMISASMKSLINGIVFLENNEYTIADLKKLIFVQVDTLSLDTPKFQMLDTGNFMIIDPVTQPQRNQEILNFLAILLKNLSPTYDITDYYTIDGNSTGNVIFSSNIESKVIDFYLVLTGRTEIPIKSLGDLLAHPLITGAPLSYTDQFGKRVDGEVNNNNIIFSRPHHLPGFNISKSDNIDDILKAASKIPNLNGESINQTPNSLASNLPETDKDIIPENEDLQQNSTPQNHHIVQKSEVSNMNDIE